MEVVIADTKKRKRKEKEIKGDMVAGNEEPNTETGERENKKGNMMEAGKEDKKKKRKEKEAQGSMVTGNEEPNTETDESEKKKGNMMEVEKGDKKKKKKKRKVKETQGSMVTGNEEPNTETDESEKKKGNMMEADKEDKKKKKKRKVKETKGDMVAANEELNTETDVSEKKKGNMTEARKENNNKKKNRKEKETKGDMVAANEEPNTETDEREKKKKKRKGKETEGDMVAANEEPNTKTDEREKKKKKKRQGKETKGDMEGKADCNVPKSKTWSRKKVKFSDEVEVFPLQGKRFSKEEDEMIRKAILAYAEKRDLGPNGEDMVLHGKSHPEVRGCWTHIAQDVPRRTPESVYYRAHVLYERNDKRRWTEEEVAYLRESYKKHGAKWKDIATELGRFRHHAKDTFRRIGLIDQRNRGHWSQEEYQALFDNVNKDIQMKIFTEKRSKHGMLRDDIAWGAISDALKTRDMGSCCGKWYAQLVSPMVKDDIWCNADDYWLLEALVDLDASCEEEVVWDSLLEHRSGDVCLMRWKQMVRHIGKRGNKTFAEEVDILSKRYCPEMSEVREALDARPIVD